MKDVVSFILVFVDIILIFVFIYLWEKKTRFEFIRDKIYFLLYLANRAIDPIFLCSYLNMSEKEINIHFNYIFSCYREFYPDCEFVTGDYSLDKKKEVVINAYLHFTKKGKKS